MLVATIKSIGMSCGPTCACRLSTAVASWRFSSSTCTTSSIVRPLSVSSPMSTSCDSGGVLLLAAARFVSPPRSPGLAFLSVLSDLQPLSSLLAAAEVPFRLRVCGPGPGLRDLEDLEEVLLLEVRRWRWHRVTRGMQDAGCGMRGSAPRSTYCAVRIAQCTRIAQHVVPR